MKITLRPTGKGHVNASSATGRITFYNGQTYTQMIPLGTILTGADGVVVITDAQASIPPATQTVPPTYGQTSVPAHALTPGAKGNIQAGDINIACCVTSVIAQNPYSFTGGANARDFTYLSRQDVSRAFASLAPALKKQTIATFTASIVLHPACSAKSVSSPAIGQETKTATLTLEATCNAVSYNLSAAKKHVAEQAAQLGSLTNIRVSLVGLSERKGVIRLRLFITAVVKPLVRLRFGNTGK